MNEEQVVEKLFNLCNRMNEEQARTLLKETIERKKGSRTGS